jgi:hypothetical protein
MPDDSHSSISRSHDNAWLIGWRPVRIPKKERHESGNQQERKREHPVTEESGNHREHYRDSYEWNSVANHFPKPSLSVTGRRKRGATAVLSSPFKLMLEPKRACVERPAVNNSVLHAGGLFGLEHQ